MTRIFTFRGYTLEQLKQLNLEQFSKISNSSVRRSLLRGLTERQKKLLAAIKMEPTKFHKTHERDMIILPEMIGVKLGVFNGKEYIPVTVEPEMIGHRLGEFSLTRKKVQHSAPGVGATRSSRHIPLK